MATGPDHYRRAQELLTEAYGLPAGSGNELGALLAAQVHATLALAAATALSGRGQNLGTDGWRHAGMYTVDFEAWYDVAGVEGE